MLENSRPEEENVKMLEILLAWRKLKKETIPQLKT